MCAEVHIKFVFSNFQTCIVAIKGFFEKLPTTNNDEIYTTEYPTENIRLILTTAFIWEDNYWYDVQPLLTGHILHQSVLVGYLLQFFLQEDHDVIELVQIRYY